MKKLFLLMFLFIIPFIFKNKDIEIINETNEEAIIFYYNENILKGIPLEIKEDKIVEAFNYLSINSNSAKKGYNTKLDLNNTLSDYNVLDNDLYLYSEIDEKADSLKQIYITYQFMGYDNIFYNNLMLEYLINPINSGVSKQRIVSIIDGNYIVNDYLTDNKSLKEIIQYINYYDYEILSYRENEAIEIEVNKLNNEYYLIIEKTIKFNYNKSLNLIVKK